MCNHENFVIVTDSASNLTEDLLKEYDIKMLPYIVDIDGVEVYCYEEGMDYESSSKDFYDKMRAGVKIKTTLINGERFRNFVEPYVKDGSDVLFVSLSSGVSGTYSSTEKVCKDLMLEYPERKCYAIDSLAASFGEGLLVMEAAHLRDEGIGINEVRDILDTRKMKLRQIFTVEDLEYLMRGGRISRITAVVGSILQIKPILKGNEEGKIVSYLKVKGKKRALETMAREFADTAVCPEEQVIAIAHCDCMEDAQALADKIRALSPVKDILIRGYDFCTGAHAGPGTVALFFWGEKR